VAEAEVVVVIQVVAAGILAAAIPVADDDPGVAIRVVAAGILAAVVIRVVETQIR
jgi:hypothetical protein